METKNRAIAIFGAGGQAKVVADICESCGWVVAGLYSDTQDHPSVGHWPMGGGRTEFLRESRANNRSYIVAIGDNAVRQRITQELRHELRWAPISCISPQAMISRRAKIAEGVCVAPGAVINVDAIIEPGAIINTGATVDHDCHIGPYAAIQPGSHLGGGVIVGERSTIGIGASVRQYISIGSDVLVGGGAMVINNIDSGLTVVGIPAKIT